MTDHRERPWRKLRVIVEVTVPPTSRATEKDLKYHVETNMPRTITLRRTHQPNGYEAVVRTKAFTPFWPMFLRIEKGLRVGRKKENL